MRYACFFAYMRSTEIVSATPTTPMLIASPMIAGKSEKSGQVNGIMPLVLLATMCTLKVACKSVECSEMNEVAHRNNKKPP